MIDKSSLHLKLADFGFATQKQIDCLTSYRGTFTYMAPEIKECKTYCGLKADLFSFGVILFILTQGFFPFKEAVKHEFFYNLLYTEQFQLYFEKVNGSNLTSEFKDLFTKLMSYNPDERPTVSEIKAHPWMKESGSKTNQIQKFLSKIIRKNNKAKKQETKHVKKNNA